MPIGGFKLREIAGDALIDTLKTPLHLGLGEVLVPSIDGLELRSSMATLAALNRSSLRHSATNSRQTSRMAWPLSLRKSAMVLKSGASCPVNQISSMLRWHSRSSRRLDGTRLR